MRDLGMKDTVRAMVANQIVLLPLSAVRGVVSINLERTRRVLSQLSSVDSDHYPSKAPQALDRVCLAGMGLLNRTEEMLDRLLPREDVGSVCNEDLEEDKVTPLPRQLVLGRLHTFAVRVNPWTVLRVTIFSLHEKCASAIQRFRDSDCRVMLDRGSSSSRLQPKCPQSQPALAAKAAEFAHRGCERLLGDQATLRVLGAAHKGCELLLGDTATDRVISIARRLAARILGTGIDECDFGIDVGAKKVPQHDDSPQVSSIAKPPLDTANDSAGEMSGHSQRESYSSATSSCSAASLKVVIKNSFIEVVEEPISPPRVRRARSVDAGFDRCIGTSDPYDVLLDCINCLGLQDRGYTGSIGTSVFSELEASQPNSNDVQEQIGNSSSSDSSVEHQLLQGGGVTVFLKGLPPDFITPKLLELLDAIGFSGKFNFVYAPVDFASGQGLGHARVCFLTERVAAEAVLALNGFSQWGTSSTHVCTACVDEGVQGLAEQIERYRNSPVMHKKVPDIYKPAYFSRGTQVPFPEPTQAIRPPRIRRAKH